MNRAFRRDRSRLVVEWVGSIIDYVHHHKFVPQETARPDGSVEQGGLTRSRGMR
jgi:hypothetical protein